MKNERLNVPKGLSASKFREITALKWKWTLASNKLRAVSTIDNRKVYISIISIKYHKDENRTFKVFYDKQSDGISITRKTYLGATNLFKLLTGLDYPAGNIDLYSLEDNIFKQYDNSSTTISKSSYLDKGYELFTIQQGLIGVTRLSLFIYEDYIEVMEGNLLRFVCIPNNKYEFNKFIKRLESKL